MMTLPQIYDNLRKTISVYRIVKSPHFVDLYESASLDSQKIVQEFIFTNDKKKIISWISFESGEVSNTKLRKLAKDYGVINYNRLTTDGLWRSLIRIFGSRENILLKLFN
jgi:hypothetical protein